MPDGVTIVRERQLRIRREMDWRGISLKAVSLDSGIPYDTIKSYFPGERDKQPATIPGSAIFCLCSGKDGKGPVLPLDLISLLLPDGFQVIRAPEEINHDEIEQAMLDYLACKARAHHPESPAGREIAPCEDEELTGKITQLRAAS